MPQARIASLWRYPVKSLLGESLERVQMSVEGLDGDRAFALLDASSAAVASAKNPRKWAGMLALTATYAAAEALIRLPDKSTIRSDGPDVDAVLSAVLSRTVRLVREPPTQLVLERYWPDIDGLAPTAVMATQRELSVEPDRVVTRRTLGARGPGGRFHDAMPVHLVTTATLAKLADLNPERGADLRRLRPNLVVDTGDAEGFVENDWCGRTVTVGEVVLRISGPTARCIVPALAHGDLPAEEGLVRAVARHNRLPLGDNGRYGCAGVYAEVLQPGTVTVGDSVEVGPHQSGLAVSANTPAPPAPGG
ncbi:MAG: MOSC domain-containing protein [Actinomycetota bacterium]|nr:MOSC domain-containing protein [Actinomycetota bacterium]